MAMMKRKRLCLALVAAASLALPATAQAAGYEAEVLADDPLTYWRLNDSVGVTAHDASVDGRDGTYAAGFTLGVSAPFSTAGVTVDLTAGGNVSGSIPTASRTLELWVNPDRLNRNQQTGIAAHGNPAVDGWALGVGVKAQTFRCLRNRTVRNPITLASNAWTLVTVLGPATRSTSMSTDCSKSPSAALRPPVAARLCSAATAAARSPEASRAAWTRPQFTTPRSVRPTFKRTSHQRRCRSTQGRQ